MTETPAGTDADATADAAHRLIETLRDNENSAMEAVRKFVDTVNDAFPDLGEDGPRRKIIDAAFRMAEQIVGVGSKLAIDLVELSEDALDKVEARAERERAAATSES